MNTVKSGDTSKEKRLARQRRYREKHREALRVKGRIYDAEHREESKAYREANKEKLNAYKKEWYQRNKSKVLARVKKRAIETTTRRKEYLNEYRQRPEVKEMKKKYSLDERKKYPVKIKARRLAYSALKTGELVKKPCEFENCFETKVEMHHANYTKPLEVTWYCKKHHMMADGRMPYDVINETPPNQDVSPVTVSGTHEARKE